MVLSKWPWGKLGSLESGFICAAVAATGLAIWKKDYSVDSASEQKDPEIRPRVALKNFFKRSSFSLNSETYQVKLNDSISKAKDLCQMIKDEYGLPGLVIAISVNGNLVWDEGFGYADLENRLPMKSNAVLRIASISKSMTMAMMATLIEDGKINLDCPIQTYLPKFPKKTVDGEDVTITTRQLLSHMSGIRHYAKKGEKEPDGEDDFAEFLFKEKCKTVEDALEMFQHDELLHKPGTKYTYTTHGWTVVSAIIEKLTETPFPKHSENMFNLWGLKNTFLDEHEPLVYHRTRYYSRKKSGRLVNSPYVDNSYKWAGGGFQSNVFDLNQFAHILLASFQNDSEKNIENKELRGLSNKPYLKSSTIQQLWTPVPLAYCVEESDFRYGMGFQLANPVRKCLFCKEIELMTVVHTGGAMGSSSILYMAFPKDYRFQIGYDEVYDDNSQYLKALVNKTGFEEIRVKGIVIAMITNLTNISLSKTANEIANVFKWML